MAAVEKVARTRLKNALRAIENRNYRLFFFGQGVSLIGTWMQMVALGWLVQRLTGSAWMLGVVGFINRAPAALLCPVAGVVVDRCNKHRIVVWCQVLAMFQAFALAWLTLTGQIQVWQLAVLSAGLGLVSAIEVPARQSFFVELVENRDDLANAIALNSSLFNGARLIGPAVAGALIAGFGEGICFLLNGVSYVAVIAALLIMTVKPFELPAEIRPVWHDLVDGCRYVLAMPPIRDLIMLIALTSLLGTPYTVLMPNYADAILHSGSRGMGYLTAAGGLGALCGALYLAQRKSVRGLLRVIPWATTVFGVGLLLLSASQIYWLSLLLMLLVGSGMMVQMGSANTLVQTLVDDDKRGRVMGLYTLAFMGTAPLGSLLAGSLAHRIGVLHTFEACGLCSLASAAWFVRRTPALRRFMRPIYIEKGILPGETPRPADGA